MTRWGLLRLQDVRAVYRLIGECRDLGNDPARWYPRMAEGLCRLIGAPMISGGEAMWIRPGPVQPVSSFGMGFDPRGHERLMAYVRENGPAHDPIYQALQRLSGRVLTHSRRQLVRDAEWSVGRLQRVSKTRGCRSYADVDLSGLGRRRHQRHHHGPGDR